jgi:uncharacterized protein YndB with AHSA1/START domain
MSDIEVKARTKALVLEYELDAPPEKVWRAISTPAFREKWLPKSSLTDVEPLSSTPGEEVRFGMREAEPPFLESVVTFQLRPNGIGGTRLRIVHGLSDARLGRRPQRAANSNRSSRMLAA